MRVLGNQKGERIGRIQFKLTKAPLAFRSYIVAHPKESSSINVAYATKKRGGRGEKANRHREEREKKVRACTLPRSSRSWESPGEIGLDAAERVGDQRRKKGVDVPSPNSKTSFAWESGIDDGGGDLRMSSCIEVLQGGGGGKTSSKKKKKAGAGLALKKRAASPVSDAL